MSKLPPVYSPAEERTNVWTHAAGAVIALAGVIDAFFIAPPSGVAGTAGYLVYGVSLVLMYLASACYHGVSEPSRRTLLRRFDHAAIYLLIAGTYTPVLLLAVGGRLGAWLLAAIWSLAAAGIAMTVLAMGKYPKISLTLYLVMGWLCLPVLKTIIAGMSATAFAFLLGGGVAYTLGVIFYVQKRPFSHAIWHLFVLAGSILQFFSVINLR